MRSRLRSESVSRWKEKSCDTELPACTLSFQVNCLVTESMSLIKISECPAAASSLPGSSRKVPGFQKVWTPVNGVCSGGVR